MKLKMAIVLCLLTLCHGCGTLTHKPESILDKISVDMTKAQVSELIGRPTVVRASRVIKDHRYEVHEYRLLYNLRGFTNTYWLHYINDRLVFWGREGDFSGAPNEVIEFRLTTGEKIK